MARKQSGGFNKFLNFIGLVDDVDPRESYGEEYSSGNYGRPSAYVPQQQRNARTSTPGGSRTAQPQQRRSLPAQAGRSTYGGQRTYGDDDFRSRRTTASASRFDEDFAPDAPAQEPRSSQSRTRSRFEEDQQPARRPAAPAPAPRVRVSPRQRTVMFSLHTLEDCCEVIDNLIGGNTIVLTMDELDGRLMQRAVDTLSGAVFALHATIRKASDKTYLIAPMGVEVNETYDVDRRF